MLENLQRFLNDLVDGIERFGKTIESFFSLLLNGVLNFLESAYRWITDTIKRIREYLVRLFMALANLSVALFKLSLFYIPCLIFIAVYFFTRSGGWIIAAVVWFLFITAIGLTYGRRERGRTHDRTGNPWDNF